MDRIEHFISQTKYNDPLFIYSKHGIILNKGQNKGLNLSKVYIGNECEIIELLDKIADDSTKHLKTIIKMVKDDLKDLEGGSDEIK